MPLLQEQLDLGGETKILDVAGDTFPLDDAAVEAVGYFGQVAKVHPVCEKMEGRWIGEGQEEDRVVGRGGHQPGLTIRGDACGGAGRWWCLGVHEIEGEGTAEETAEIRRVRGQVVHVQLKGESGHRIEWGLRCAPVASA